MRNTLTVVVVSVVCLATSVSFGQTRTSGVLPLPEGVKDVTAIDSQNSLLVSAEKDNRKDLHYELVSVRHVYAGGIARLFGGGVIPTALMATPALVNTGGSSPLNSAFQNFNPSVAGIGGTGISSLTFISPIQRLRPRGPRESSRRTTRPSNP